MQEMWVQSLDWEDPLEEEMATDSSTLAWEIPWTEEPGELQSTVLQKSRTRLSKQLNNNDKASPNIGSVVKNPPASGGDMGSVPGLGRSPGEGNGYPPQYFCLENSKDRGAW